MTPLVVGCITLLVVVIAAVALLVSSVLTHQKATELLLIGRITEAIRYAGVVGDITPSPAISDSHLSQATITSHEVTVECSWPTDWPPTHGEHALPLVRMFVGRLGPAPWRGYCELSFVISHGIGANDGRTPEDMLIYAVSGESAQGKHFSYEGTVTTREAELQPSIQALSEAIATIERRLRTSNPA